MSKQWDEDRRHLLEALQNIGNAGRAEGASPKEIPLAFYPVAEHLRLLDPDVVLVVGPRGSGKTSIARVLTDASLYDAVANYAPAVRLPEGKSDWVPIYPGGRDTFDGVGLRAFIQAKGNATTELRELWFAYLIRALRKNLPKSMSEDLGELLALPGADAISIHAAFRRLGPKSTIVLDQLDQDLEKRNRYVFATYDELDVLGNGDWELVEAGVRGLVALWAAYARRWKRIRAKLFLRTDLYERHAKAGGADLAKLAAGRVELIWNDRDLYGLLLKRMANVNSDLATYVAVIKGITWESDKTLGRIPRLKTKQEAKPVIERMVGIYMGANQKKGLVYRWLLDHVRDGQGRIYPRPFIGLIEEAVRQELRGFTSLRYPRLLEPTSLRRALDRVSADHVTQARSEWPWLDTITVQLSADPLVPYDEREVLKLLDDEVTSQNFPQLPFYGRELLEYLLEVGVFRRRPDNRIDTPDLYLAGLGLKRKGGVSMRKGRYA